MNDVLRVEVVYGRQDSKQELLRQVFRVHTLLHDAVEQIAAAHEVHHKIHRLLSLYKNNNKSTVAQKHKHTHTTHAASETKQVRVTRDDKFESKG